MSSDWEKTAREKRESLIALIPEEWRISDPPSPEKQVDVTGSYIEQFLTQEESNITNTDAFGIAEKVASREWTAVKVIKAFNHRAALAHQLTNCLLEIFFEAGEQRAQELDDHLEKTGKTVGPLHGVPVSLKDQFHVKGVETSMAYVGWIGTFQGKKGTGLEKTFESELAKDLRNAGAVFYCKTSVPPTLMSGETVNNIVGYCWSPQNRHLSAGGSSGGEGALIGAHGSPLGFGTDIGGSIRIPAAFNGLFGIRPSVGRMPYHGLANSLDGQNTVLSVVGPLATTSRSVRLAFETVLAQEPWYHDPLCHELPWRQSVYDEFKKLAAREKEGKLCFGIIHDDGEVTPQPPVARALKEIEEALRKEGHEVVTWEPRLHNDLMNSLTECWKYDGGDDCYNAFQLSKEPPPKQVGFQGLEPSEPFTGIQIAENNRKMRSLRKEHMDYWNSTVSETSTGRPIDAIICPVAPFSAARPLEYKYYGYSGIFNALDYSSMTFPVTTADKSIDRPVEGYEHRNVMDKSVHDLYDADIYHGAPVALQLVGRRLQEEKVIAIVEHFEALLSKK